MGLSILRSVINPLTTRGYHSVLSWSTSTQLPPPLLSQPLCQLSQVEVLCSETAPWGPGAQLGNQHGRGDHLQPGSSHWHQKPGLHIHIMSWANWLLNKRTWVTLVLYVTLVGSRWRPHWCFLVGSDSGSVLGSGFFLNGAHRSINKQIDNTQKYRVSTIQKLTKSSNFEVWSIQPLVLRSEDKHKTKEEIKWWRVVGSCFWAYWGGQMVKESKIQGTKSVNIYVNIRVIWIDLMLVTKHQPSRAEHNPLREQ